MILLSPFSSSSLPSSLSSMPLLVLSWSSRSSESVSSSRMILLSPFSSSSTMILFSPFSSSSKIILFSPFSSSSRMILFSPFSSSSTMILLSPFSSSSSSLLLLSSLLLSLSSSITLLVLSRSSVLSTLVSFSEVGLLSKIFGNASISAISFSSFSLSCEERLLCGKQGDLSLARGLFRPDRPSPNRMRGGV